MAQQYDKEPDKALATRTGSLALLIHSIGKCQAHAQQGPELTWTPKQSPLLRG
jgi:hypothetical protein